MRTFLASSSAGSEFEMLNPEMQISDVPRIVAIGASAGGLHAFQELFETLPDQTGMSFVILSHILRGSRSLLPEILARSTKMPVEEVKSEVEFRPNHVYVIPPDKFLGVSDRSLFLIDRPEGSTNSAIDYFMFSLAENHIRGGIAVVLSGEGSDGSRGIKRLSEHSGSVTMAQEPESASSKSMPIHAIQMDHVDYILFPHEIALKIAEISLVDTNSASIPLRVLWNQSMESSHHS